jgi:hypothetical protein
LALNTADGKLFTKLSSGTVVDLTGTFSGTITPRANDGAALGTGTLMWSDLFLANSSVINFNNGDVTLTHSSNLLTMAGGNFMLSANDGIIHGRCTTSTGWTTLEAQAHDYTTSFMGSRIGQFSSAATGTTLGIANAGLGHLVFQNCTNAVLGTNSATDLILVTQTARRMTIYSGGNVAIGASSAPFKLTVGNDQYDGVWAWSGSTISYLGIGGYANGTDGAAGLRYDRAGSNLYIYNGSRDTRTDRIALFGSGFVSIGNSTNLFRLLVSDNATDGCWMFSSGSDSYLGLGGYASGTDAAGGMYFARGTGGLHFWLHSRDTRTSRMEMSTTWFAPTSNDGMALGYAGRAWADLYLASGALLDFGNNNTRITHSANLLTLTNGDFLLSKTTATISARSVSNTSFAAVDAQQHDYTTNYGALRMIQYGSAATSTTLGVSNAGLSALVFQNSTSAVIGTNGSCNLQFATVSSVRMYLGSGLVIGTPTGGDKGAGSLNASTVYDDNVLLTDYVFDHWQDGRLAPEDEDNERALAFNPALLDIDTFTASCRERRALPAMLRRSEWSDETRFSLGELAQRLWEVAEIQAVHIAKLNERLKVLEAQ